jgi:GT2 family glycosyltransferase
MDKQELLCNGAVHEPSRSAASRALAAGRAPQSNVEADPIVSVVIVSFNTRDMLRDCLNTLQRATGGLTAETIVIDNASSDQSADMVAAEFPQVHLLRSDVNLGFAAANNRCFAIARGRYIVLLNSDAFPQPDALSRSIQHMEEHREVGLAGGILVGRNEKRQPSARMFPSPLNELLMLSGLADSFPKSRFFGRFDFTWADLTRPMAVDWIPGAYTIIRRSVLERVGFFDERFFFYYEEVDLCRRVKAAGSEVWYWPDVVVVHLGGESAKRVKHHAMSRSSQLLLWRMRAGLLYYRKHHGALGAWTLRLIETWWNRLRALRNERSQFAERQAKARESRLTAELMHQAWVETRGGKFCPPRPW